MAKFPLASELSQGDRLILPCVNIAESAGQSRRLKDESPSSTIFPQPYLVCVALMALARSCFTWSHSGCSLSAA